MTATSVQTVCGAVPIDRLGPTLVHEHVLVDLERAYCAGAEAESQLPFCLENLGVARRSFVRVEGVGVLDDVETAVSELALFRNAGGTTVVDASSVGIRAGTAEKHPIRLAEVSMGSGVDVILGCGFYVAAAQSEEVLQLDVATLTDWMLDEIHSGVAGTDIRTGVIGEVGLGQPLHSFEWRSLEAACNVQKLTGLPLLIHPHYGVNSTIAEEAAHFTLDRGVDPAKIVMCHMDGYSDIDGLSTVLALGVWCAIDGFGLEIYYDHDDYNHNSHDALRESRVLKAVELGYADRLLLSQDVCMKLQLARYGGHGYGHLLRNIRGSSARRGMSLDQFDSILRQNPQRLFAG